MFTRHRRFLIALAMGVAVWLGAVVLGLPRTLGPLMAADAFCLGYLVLMARFAARVTPDDLRRHAAGSDEGTALILSLAAGVVLVSLSSIGLMLTGAPVGGVEVGLALASVPLGWAMVHVLMAFHYAMLFYAKGEDGDVGGLAFPGGGAPGAWDFLYHSFTVGMTAQVSDVTVQTTALRRVTLAHGVGSFFYNAVIVALAVNGVVGLG